MIVHLLPRSSNLSVTLKDERIKTLQEYGSYAQSCNMALPTPFFLAQSSLLHVLACNVLVSSGMFHNPSARSCTTHTIWTSGPKLFGAAFVPPVWANSENSMSEFLTLKWHLVCTWKEDLASVIVTRRITPALLNADKFSLSSSKILERVCWEVVEEREVRKER